MRSRIQRLIESEKLTPAQFADKVGIQRSTLSHILNGRNNASTDIILKIHAIYPNVSVNWLMFGEGNIYQRISTDVSSTAKSVYSLFDEISMKTDDLPNVSEYAKDFELNSTEKIAEKIEISPDLVHGEKPKSIVKIMIFYSDNSFETFSPDIIR